MSGFFEFIDRYGDEASCISAVAALRWPEGFALYGVWRPEGVPTGIPTARL